MSIVEVYSSGSMDQEKRLDNEDEIKRLPPAFRLLVEFYSKRGISTERLPRSTSENTVGQGSGDEKRADRP